MGGPPIEPNGIVETHNLASMKVLGSHVYVRLGINARNGNTEVSGTVYVNSHHITTFYKKSFKHCKDKSK